MKSEAPYIIIVSLQKIESNTNIFYIFPKFKKKEENTAPYSVTMSDYEILHLLKVSSSQVV